MEWANTKFKVHQDFASMDRDYRRYKYVCGLFSQADVKSETKTTEW